MTAAGATAMFTIGELAKRTGLPVKTIRFYSDEGLLPPTDRTPAGYRLYDTTALARLELVRTLRELGIGLAEVSAVLVSEATVAQLATRHVDALDEQIRALTLRRAVLRAVAKRGSEPEEVKLMNKLASMSDGERKRLLDEFWEEVSAGLDVDPDFYEWMRSAKPELPEDPTPEQLEAWIELAELVKDADFRRLIRGMSERHSTARAEGADMSASQAQQERWFSWNSTAQAALDEGVDPDSARGRELAAEIASTSAPAGRESTDPAYRRELAEQIAVGIDPRAEHYWRLLGIINGWEPFPSRVAAATWIVEALRASAGPAA
ncbi:MerR family transcriptional regulator [Amycolatopsis cihanbeyliensis]|uniref:DNA-binding transcriptional MerR regulator n=1 Tax=Amycolatopsis cihanbeyliensis TaxID=1128664 RepID=A0A542DN30_AMYCI|nr:MerR family transcriptional regulator [Amycolatopsis cihanbeyliensis]TQJ04512.1 DNA-binding transcriptional MerR regulator [Amycolatopsis cihanbeyliensis]